MASSNDRSRRCRARRRAGKLMVWAEVDGDELRDILIAAGLLRQWDQEQHSAINSAFQQAVNLWVGREIIKLQNAGQF